MMVVHCDDCSRQVLLWPVNLDGITNVEGRILVAWHCHRGHRGVHEVPRRDRRVAA